MCPKLDFSAPDVKRRAMEVGGPTAGKDASAMMRRGCSPKCMSLEHTFMECKASDATVCAQNRLWNFHVRTRKKNVNSARACALSEEDDGEERAALLR